MLSGLVLAETMKEPADVMLHELLVHKVELEMQIEELQRAQKSMEAARDHYAEYYEFAPVGYFSISREGLITEINMTGAELLGVERTALINRRLANFVSPADGDRWDRLFLSLIEGADLEKKTFFLVMTRVNGGTFNAYCECRRLQPDVSLPSLRLALFDSDKCNRTTSN